MPGRLRRTSPEQPGWTRRRSGRGFVFVDEHGQRLAAEDVARCRALVIPPAWREVWICPYPNGHLQAVGMDDAGRRQYVYHPKWVEQRAALKHERVVQFARRLPTLRERVRADIASERTDLPAACALAVRLMDLGYFRIGNDVYTEVNGSFGLTTLERRHVRRRGTMLVFEFVGKSGVEHHVEIEDAVVLTVVERMRRRRHAASGPLLSFKDGSRWRPLTPGHVNDYLRQTTGLEVSAKDFRTWHGTVLAAAALADAPPAASGRTVAKRAVAAAMREVADYLGNTPALARSAYVDPRVIDAYEEGVTIASAVRRDHPDPDVRQAALERATLRLLT